jgi:hypothetical protein
MDIIFVFLCLVVLYFFQRNYLIEKLNKHNHTVSKIFFDLLFVVHNLFFLLYYLYSTSKRSDSLQYYQKTLFSSSWLEFLGTGTNFIRFLTYPFSHYLHLSFPAISLIFSFLGFQGMVFYYLTAIENIFGQKNIYFNLTILELLFLLPNCHFWSSSLGKGSVMILGIALIMFALSNFKKRYLLFVFSLLLVLAIRPHIVFILLICLVICVIVASNIKILNKILIASVLIIVVVFISGFVSTFIKSDFTSIFIENSTIYNKAKQLSTSNSGYDINHYNQLFRLFTFLFRPLFVDSPNILGTITSLENVIGIFLFLHLFYMLLKSSIKWNNFMLFSFIFFFVSSLMLAQVCGNLGIAIRQKAQIMPLFFMIYVKIYIDYKNFIYLKTN